MSSRLGQHNFMFYFLLGKIHIDLLSVIAYQLIKSVLLNNDTIGNFLMFTIFRKIPPK